MDTPTTIFVIILFALLLGQIILSWLQIRRFNRAFAALKRGAYIGVGRNSRRRFQPRVLIALSFDEHKMVIDSIMLQGYGFYMLPKPITQLHGKYIHEIDPQAIFPEHPACQHALASALTAQTQQSSSIDSNK